MSRSETTLDGGSGRQGDSAGSRVSVVEELMSSSSSSLLSCAAVSSSDCGAPLSLVVLSSSPGISIFGLYGEVAQTLLMSQAYIAAKDSTDTIESDRLSVSCSLSASSIESGGTSTSAVDAAVRNDRRLSRSSTSPSAVTNENSLLGGCVLFVVSSSIFWNGLPSLAAVRDSASRLGTVTSVQTDDTASPSSSSEGLSQGIYVVSLTLVSSIGWDRKRRFVGNSSSSSSTVTSVHKDLDAHTDADDCVGLGLTSSTAVSDRS
mmetsp:Transcript_469/g.1199  ORF Transcript_469/g.1199 Transcript_469/m.1199 type:complete len:262 (+) Transcript_469:1047-1832(+)